MTPAAPRPGWIERACPLCGGRTHRSRWTKGELRIVDCDGCGFVFANPIRTTLATGEFYDAMGASFYLAPDKLASDYAPVRYERELALFRRHCPSGAVLDVGCSTGGFLAQLRRTGAYETVGTDVTAEALAHAEQQGIEVIRGAFLDQDFGHRRFDAVTFWAVWEHLEAPRDFLAKAAGLLRPGGHLLALVPNLESLAIRICGVRYRYVMPDHINYFSAHTLRALAATAPALEVIELRTMHFNPVVIWQDWRRLRDRVPDAERARLLQRTTRWKQTGWLQPVRWAYRATEGLLRLGGLADNLVIVLRRR